MFQPLLDPEMYKDREDEESGYNSYFPGDPDDFVDKEIVRVNKVRDN